MFNEELKAKVLFHANSLREDTALRGQGLLTEVTSAPQTDTTCVHN